MLTSVLDYSERFQVKKSQNSAAVKIYGLQQFMKCDHTI